MKTYIGNKKGYLVKRFLVLAMALSMFAAGAVVAPPRAVAGTAISQFDRMVDVSGATSAGIKFTGLLQIVRFMNAGSTISIQGLLTGSFDTVGHVTNLLVTIPVTVKPNPADCNIVNVNMLATDLLLLGKVVHMAPMTLLLEGTNPPSPTSVATFGKMVCSLTGMPNSGMALALNKILALFP